MKIKHAKTIFTATIVCGSAIVLSVPAAAYIDPATTSYIIQIIVGVVIACGTAAGIIINKMRRKFRKKNDEQDSTEEKAVTRTARGGVMTAADLLEDGDSENSDSSRDSDN